MIQWKVSWHTNNGSRGVDNVRADTPWKACGILTERHNLPVQTYFSPTVID